MAPDVHLSPLVTQKKIEIYYRMSIPWTGRDGSWRYSESGERGFRLRVEEEISRKKYLDGVRDFALFLKSPELDGLLVSTWKLKSQVLDDETVPIRFVQEIAEQTMLIWRRNFLRKSLKMDVESLGPRGWHVYSEDELNLLDFSWIENDAIWTFLFRRIHAPGTTRVMKGIASPNTTAFWELFRKTFGSKRPASKLKKYYETQLAPHIHKAFLCGEMKAKLYYGLDIPIHPIFLGRCRDSAIVILDSRGCIVFLRQRNGLVLGAPPKNFPPTPRQRIADEDTSIWQFLLKQVHDPKTGKVVRLSTKTLTSCTFWHEYQQSTGSNLSVSVLVTRFFTTMAPRLHLVNISIEAKVKLYFGLVLKVDDTFLSRLQKFAHVELDRNGSMVEYRERKYGGLKLSYTPNRVCNALSMARMSMTDNAILTGREDLEMWIHVYKKLRDPLTGSIRKAPGLTIAAAIWEEFAAMKANGRSGKAYFYHFKNYLIPHLHLMNMHKRAKVALYYGLLLPVHAEFLSELKQDAIIELDEDGCIVLYKERKKRVHSETDRPKDVVDIVSDDDEEEDGRGEVKKGKVKVSVKVEKEDEVEMPSDEIQENVEDGPGNIEEEARGAIEAIIQILEQQFEALIV
ncbi:unnamed protein product [Caenorhabditis sp. 36 PRJEB53466]|nr:unnamed protein product [Caenorhabditis sp. 36 PRJEB53466]